MLQCWSSFGRKVVVALPVSGDFFREGWLDDIPLLQKKYNIIGSQYLLQLYYYGNVDIIGIVRYCRVK